MRNALKALLCVLCARLEEASILPMLAKNQWPCEKTHSYNKNTPLKLVPLPPTFSGDELPARVEMRARSTIVADPPHGPAHAPPLARVVGPVCRVPEVLELAPRALEARRRVRAGERDGGSGPERGE